MYQLKNMRVRHLQIVEYMLANPAATYEEISLEFSVSVPWISVIYKSQLFQTKLRQRMAEHETFTDLTVIDQVQGVAQLALEKLANCIHHSGDPDFILDATDKLLRRAGYGTAGGSSVTVNNNNNSVTNVVQVDSSVLAECRALLNGEEQPKLLEAEVVDVAQIPVRADAEARTVEAG